MKDLPENLREPFLDEINNIIDEVDEMAMKYNVSQDEVMAALCKIYLFASQLTDDGKLNPLQEEIYKLHPEIKTREDFSRNFPNN